MTVIKTPFGHSAVVGVLKAIRLAPADKALKSTAKDERVPVIWPERIRTLRHGAGEVPLDQPPLIKLAAHLRGKGYVAVAFPEEVRIFLPGANGSQGYAAHSVKGYTAALDVLGRWEASTTSYTV
ncbi:hypothetical protein [Parvularcula lutaonensis]|uniref:Uncharacterized protein n=1 Tax=Parvularcula lutaonensis TaxID=491923 RepID=A0ABV7MF88_9PROT|nr:hypothetical protein [Parvularcula lutaonensis]GGY52822.1 hypothetical protein GCM10007148_22560 [Parvularcula lutaonensis]